jgi:REP element-mobilizing transposase RayT
MPRKARIDVPGVLQHIIIRGIERKRIFFDDRDRNDFLDRLGDIQKNQLMNLWTSPVFIDRFRCADLDTLRLSPTEVTVIRYISKDI